MKNLKVFVEIAVLVLTMCAGFIGVCGAEEIGVQYGVYIGYAVLAASALSWCCTSKMFDQEGNKMDLTEKMLAAAQEKARYMGIDNKKYKEASKKYYILLNEWRKMIKS